MCTHNLCAVQFGECFSVDGLNSGPNVGHKYTELINYEEPFFDGTGCLTLVIQECKQT